MGKPGPRAEPRGHDHCGAMGGEHLREISTNVIDRKDQLVRNNLQSVTRVIKTVTKEFMPLLRGHRIHKTDRRKLAQAIPGPHSAADAHC